MRRTLLALLLSVAFPAGLTAQTEPFELREGERIVFIGNTFAERMQLFAHFEALLASSRPGARLSFRNLGWSGDEVGLRPRPLNFGDIHTHLTEQGADVIFAAFGMNESYRGTEGLPEFGDRLGAFLDTLRSRPYNGATPARVVLLSPIPHEEVSHVPLDPAAHNRDLERYTEVMREVAAERGVVFVDLYHPMLPVVKDRQLGDLTINGIHLGDRGYQIVSRLIARSLGWLPEDASLLEAPSAMHLSLLEPIREKNQLFFYRWRPVNGEYIYGRRKEPFGVVNFPGEMARLDEMVVDAERQIWELASASAAR